MFYFSDNSLVFMLFFVLLYYCILIMVIVFQMKILMDTRPLNLWASKERSLFFSNNTFHNSNILPINNSLLFREPPTSVFKRYFHLLKFLKALPLSMMLLSSISNRYVLFTFSTNKVAAEEVPHWVPL